MIIQDDHWQVYNAEGRMIAELWTLRQAANRFKDLLWGETMYHVRYIKQTQKIVEFDEDIYTSERWSVVDADV